MLINDEGIVLKEIKFQEADKIITIFSRKNGKIQAVAKGARKPNSKLIASTQVFCYSDFILYRGKNLYNVSQGEVINSFYSLRNDLEKLAYATYIIELIETAILDEEPNETLFKLLLKTLVVLAHLDKDYSKLVRAFELKYISFIGYKPQLNRCIICNNEPKNKIRFSIANGGIICDECADRGLNIEYIDIETLNAMKHLLYSELDKLENLNISNKILSKIQKIIERYIISHVDKKTFKSLEFLKAIE